jgi:hypothetical protein
MGVLVADVQRAGGFCKRIGACRRSESKQSFAQYGRASSDASSSICVHFDIKTRSLTRAVVIT